MERKLQCRSPKSFIFIGLSILFMIGFSLELNAQNPNSNVDGGYIYTDDETTICVDGMPDPIDVTVEGASGRLKQWIITDDANNILALPPSPPFDLDGAGPGICRIWHLSYNGIQPFKKLTNLSDLKGRYDLSNYIEVVRNLKPEGGTISGGDNNTFTFCVDGEADNIPEGAITLTGNTGSNSQWVVTDLDLNVLGLPPTPSAPNFDAAGPGTCLIWHLSYEGDPETFFNGVTNAADLEGCFELSNYIAVIRNEADGGTLISASTYEFCVGDGEADNIPEGDITLEGNVGDVSQWIITDDLGNILGVPPNPYVVNFDGAGNGTCFVYHLSAFGAVEGVMMGSSLDAITGCFSLSNGIPVMRYQPDGGTITGGDNNTFTFNTVGDGEPDTIPEGAVTVEGGEGPNSQWIVTDEQGVILGLPPAPSAPNFDGAGPGTCLLWYMRYVEDVDLTVFENVADFDFCYDLSNAISVIRVEGSATRVSVFPNPTSTTLNVDLKGYKNENVSLDLFNMNQARVLSTSTSKNFVKLNVEGIRTGIYFLKIQNEKGKKETLKVVID